jgi:hypothetical protein
MLGTHAPGDAFASQEAVMLMRTYERRPAMEGRRAIAAVAVGAFACGALAVGALAIGALAINRLAVRRGRIRSLEIGDLRIRNLQVAHGDLLQRSYAAGRLSSPTPSVSTPTASKIAPG